MRRKHARPTGPVPSRGLLDQGPAPQQYRLHVVMAADQRYAAEEGQVATQLERIDVYQVKATRPEQVDKSGCERRGVIDKRGVHPVAADAPQVIPGEAPDAVVLGDGEYLDLDVGQLLKRVQSLGKIILRDRKSTRLNSSHGYISYAVFCLKKKKT